MTLNASLPPGKLATTIQLAYSFAVVFTFPLQNFPSLEIVHRFTEKVVNQTASSYSKPHDRTHHVMNIVSGMVVVLLSVIAVSK